MGFSLSSIENACVQFRLESNWSEWCIENKELMRLAEMSSMWHLSERSGARVKNPSM